MYKQSQYDAWVLEASNHFVKHYGYQMISMTQDSSQVWLVKQDSEDNPIMMVTSTRVDRLDYELIMKHRASLALVFKTKAEGLNMSVNQEVREGNDIDVVVGPNYCSDSKRLEPYKDITNVLKVSKNPDSSLSRAVVNLRRTLTQTQKKARYKNFPVTNIVAAVCVVIFLIAQFLILFKSINPAISAVMMGAFYKPFIVDATEWFRFITAGFLHIDLFHLLMNLMALRNLGIVMEQALGWKKYLFTLVAGILLGNAFVFILDESVIGLGLSGGLFALLGAMAVYLFETNAIKNPKVLTQMIQILFINLFISLLPNVSGAAHFGGLIAGILCGLSFSKRKDWNALRTGTYVLSALFVCGVMVVMFRQAQPLHNPFVDSSVIKSWYELGFERYANRLSRVLN